MPTPCYISIEGKTQGNITEYITHIIYARRHNGDEKVQIC